MGSEGHQDIDLAILTALLKGGCEHVCVYAGAPMASFSLWPWIILVVLKLLCSEVR